MENFVFALHATLPVFLIMVLGYFLRHIGILTEAFCRSADQYVFKVALPVSLFKSISTMDFYSDFDLTFCLFCFLATTAMFMTVWAVSWLVIRDRRMVGAFSQAAVRSSAAILGIAFVTNIYGNSGMVPMMILAAVPFFNIYAVVILSFSPQSDEEGRLLPPAENRGIAIRRACVNVLKNPIIIGILLGFPFAILRITLPPIISSVVGTVGGTATPVALLAIGGTFTLEGAMRVRKYTAVGSFVKLLLLPMLILPIAAMMGFRDSAMVAILIMCGSPTTVSCYVMAKNMHQNSELTTGLVVMTTLLSSVTITLWLFILRSIGLV